MRLRFSLPAVLLVAAAACNLQDTKNQLAITFRAPDATVTHAIVTVQPGAVVDGTVWRIRSRARVEDAESVANLPDSPPRESIHLPTTYAVVAQGHRGTLTLDVDALGADGFSVGRGHATVELKPDHGVAVSVDLAKPCSVGADCQDGVYCNGVETCVEGTCRTGTNPCSTGVDCVDGICHEEVDECEIILHHEQCGADSYCNRSRGCELGAACQADADCAGQGDFCHPQKCGEQKKCVPDQPRTVDDLNPCTYDACDPRLAQVAHVPYAQGHLCSLPGDPRAICVGTGTLSCQPSTCGDGFTDLEGGEQCDDGNSDDTDTCVHCQLARCGDGQVRRGTDAGPGEECDDGNLNNADDCTNDCRLPRCQDGILHNQGTLLPYEECDDGNADSTDDCTAECKRFTCGDGVKHVSGREPFEECDDGNQDPNDGCTDTCRVARCGDGILHRDVDGGLLEECDDGNADNTDDCTNACTVARCGDGFQHLSTAVDGGGLEECDDGNPDDSDDCTSACRLARCGDQLVHAYGTPPFEECDDGNAVDTDDCTSACTAAVCGDGILRSGRTADGGVLEACDDGNPFDDDSCASCRVARCGDGIVRTKGTAAEVEECDEGSDPNDLDGCSTRCHFTRWEAEVVLGEGAACPYGANGDLGPAIGARLSQPTALAVDGAGRVFINALDPILGETRVRRVDLDGTIHTLAELVHPLVSLAADDTRLVVAQDHVVDALDPQTGQMQLRLAGTGDPGQAVEGRALFSPLPRVVQVVLEADGAVVILLDAGEVTPGTAQVWRVTDGQLAPAFGVQAVPLPIVNVAAGVDGTLYALARQGALARVYAVSNGSVSTGADLALGTSALGNLAVDSAGGVWTSVGASIVDGWTGAVRYGTAGTPGVFKGHEDPSAFYVEGNIFSGTQVLATHGTTLLVADTGNSVVLQRAAGQRWRRVAGVFPEGIPPPRDGRCVTLGDVYDLAVETDGSVVATDQLWVVGATGVHTLDLGSLQARTRFPAERGAPALHCVGGASPPYTYQLGDGLPGTGAGIKGLVVMGGRLYYHSLRESWTYRVEATDWTEPVNLESYVDAGRWCCTYTLDINVKAWSSSFCSPCQPPVGGYRIDTYPVPRAAVLAVGPMPVPFLVAADRFGCELMFVNELFTCGTFLNRLTPEPVSQYFLHACSGPAALLHQPATELGFIKAPHSTYSLLLSDTSFHRMFQLDVGPNGEFASGGVLAGRTQTPGRVAEDIPVDSENALLDTPRGAGQDREGNIYFADSGNNWLRQVDKKRIMRHVADIPNPQSIVVHPTLGVLVRTPKAVWRVRGVP